MQDRHDDVSEYAAKQILARLRHRRHAGRTRDEPRRRRSRSRSASAIRSRSRCSRPTSRTRPRRRRCGWASPSDAELAAAYDEDAAQRARLHKRTRASKACWCRKWSTGGIEAILGVTNDTLFGPAVMFGLGGIFAEVLKDVAFRLAPVTQSIAREMIARDQGLSGARPARAARAPADIDALADAIVQAVGARGRSQGPRRRTRHQSAVRVSRGAKA